MAFIANTTLQPEWHSIFSQHWLRLFELVLVSWILEQIPVIFESKYDIFYSHKYFALNEHSDSDIFSQHK